VRAYLLRPEVHPVAESDDDERRVHAALMADPRLSMDLSSMKDADAKHNYEVVLRFRDRLLEAGTVEGAYMALFRGKVDIPPLFIDQLVHVILKNILLETEDPLLPRAAELFFREQKATIKDGHALLADLETVQMHASGSRYGSLGRLIVEAQSPLGGTDLDVLDRNNAALYWERESRYDTVISVTYGRPALDALARVIEAWINHFLQLKVSVKPVRKIDEARWAWHIGLDAESTAILNELWAGSEIDAGRMRRILALFALQFDDPRAMKPDIAGRTVYLALSSDEEDVVRMKPQNLLLNLPLNEA
jgi:hypothetical protein